MKKNTANLTDLHQKIRKNKYSYKRFGSSGSRVGQAVHDVLTSSPSEHTVEEILDEFGKNYLDDIRKCADEEKKNFEGTFYIFSLMNKDLGQWGVSNVVRHWKIPRKTAPHMAHMVKDYPNHTKTLYEVSPSKGEITLLWTLPGKEECVSILKNPSLYDPQLVKWCQEAHPHKVKAL